VDINLETAMELGRIALAREDPIGAKAQGRDTLRGGHDNAENRRLMQGTDSRWYSTTKRFRQPGLNGGPRVGNAFNAALTG
jgi:hypothetical protein